MVHTYKRAKAYLTGHNNESLISAVRRIQFKELSVLAASKSYKIPYGALYKKIKANHQVDFEC